MLLLLLLLLLLSSDVAAQDLTQLDRTRTDTTRTDTTARQRKGSGLGNQRARQDDSNGKGVVGLQGNIGPGVGEYVAAKSTGYPEDPSRVGGGGRRGMLRNEEDVGGEELTGTRQTGLKE
jgi:hypothetical protein